GAEVAPGVGAGGLLRATERGRKEVARRGGAGLTPGRPLPAAVELLAARNRGPPPAICRRLREPGQIGPLHLFDLEAALREQIRNVARQITTREHGMKDRL